MRMDISGSCRQGSGGVFRGIAPKVRTGPKSLTHPALSRIILIYPPEQELFFHNSIDAPEIMLVKSYLAVHTNTTLQYHVNSSNPLCLLEQLVELGLATNQHQAFELCFNSYKNSVDGCVHFVSVHFSALPFEK